MSQFYKVSFFKIRSMESLAGLKQSETLDWGDNIDPKMIKEITWDSVDKPGKQNNMADELKIVIQDPFLYLAGKAELLENMIAVTIDAGTLEKHRVICSLYPVTDVGLDFSEGVPTVTLICQDESVLLSATASKLTMVTPIDTLREVAEKVRSIYGFESVKFVDDTTGEADKPIDIQKESEISDREFLANVAEKHNMAFNVRLGHLIFTRIKKDKDGALTSSSTKKMFDFSYRHNIGLFLKSVKIKTEKVGAFGKPLYASSDKSTISLSKDAVPMSGGMPADSYERVKLESTTTGQPVQLEIPIENQRRQILTATLVHGDVDIMCNGIENNQPIKYSCNIYGIGAYSGTWVLQNVKHAWGDKGYSTTFEAQRGAIDGFDDVAANVSLGFEHV